MSPGSVKAPVIAVVGPSGVGKDSLMEALLERIPGLVRQRRIITRAPELGGEDYDAVTEDRFAALCVAPGFALHWEAHGLRYAIPRDIDELRNRASGVLVNLSRKVLLEAEAAFGTLVILSVTATPEVLAERLMTRGREDRAEIERRLARAATPMPAGLSQVIEIDNSGQLEEAVQAAETALMPWLQPERV
ncbi:phosphonate metabolism protein/1,5-bisphosphokinase (PRPP-forming) PhnN [Phaeobacter piscinae]|uniref:Ribose 1,5-bisphosphate phosphokinase PhnN n=1 Tax=Phaeobacter piscinae TaxID=1580596 RepID=A0ABN5DC55_9RHOB|nr:phosphonate metabolism protein/1,5-bisphosphokinase (PRPP-forming) PhnN [Phaeobacter piscinae]ATG34521.1 phosphonate metabolism protein/1,5-bisphosphokinase (PRPP-forming) PhnN [Phaeobacter piscinae]AUQ85041.1 phosphonate metabolism protein/1,5-bisphosphokinase (PRPP-forming) PhnN [Phaeobacter piscinae]AUR22925.1 phosphonate metabolism protein/1,5-bisphosphokinase (PRPP-forming) PhnN [Phaeobacter piscinae]